MPRPPATEPAVRPQPVTPAKPAPAKAATPERPTSGGAKAERGTEVAAVEAKPRSTRREGDPKRGTEKSAAEKTGADKVGAEPGGDGKRGKRDAAAAKADAAKPDKKAAAKTAPKREPKDEPRIWVQVAGGANESDLPKAWSAARAKAPALARRDGYSTPLRATNRVVTGPFKSEAEAQALVNKLGKEGLSAFTFKSASGQKVTKLPAK